MGNHIEDREGGSGRLNIPRIPLSAPELERQLEGLSAVQKEARINLIERRSQAEPNYRFTSPAAVLGFLRKFEMESQRKIAKYVKEAVRNYERYRKNLTRSNAVRPYTLREGSIPLFLTLIREHRQIQKNKTLPQEFLESSDSNDHTSSARGPVAEGVADEVLANWRYLQDQKEHVYRFEFIDGVRLFHNESQLDDVWVKKQEETEAQVAYAQWYKNEKYGTMEPFTLSSAHAMHSFLELIQNQRRVEEKDKDINRTSSLKDQARLTKIRQSFKTDDLDSESSSS